MIIGRFFKRSAALMLILCCVLLCACSGDNGNALEMLGALPEDTTYTSSSNNVRIVISGFCSSEVSDAAHTLADALGKKIGIPIAVVFDSLDVIDEENITEILVGNVDREVCDEVYYSLNRDDYLCCRAMDGSVIIGGRSDSATVAAVEKFIAERLPSVTMYELLPDGGFEYFCEYEITKAMVCGFDVRDYTFVCSSDRGTYDAYVPVKLREMIANKCGAYCDIVYSDSCVEGRKEIIFRSEISGESENFAYIEKNNEDIIISGCGSYGLSVGADKLFNLLFDDASDTSASLDISYKMRFSYVSASVNILSAIFDVSDTESYINAAERLHSQIEANAPDIVLLGKVDNDMWALVKADMPKGYSENTYIAENGDILPILYRTETVSSSETMGNTEGDIHMQQIKLTHNITGRSFTLIELYSHNDDLSQCSKAVKKVLDGSSVVILHADEEKDGTFDVYGENISTELNTHITVGRIEMRYGIFTSEAELESSKIETSYSDTGNIRFSALSVRQRYCSAFCEGA